MGGIEGFCVLCDGAWLEAPWLPFVFILHLDLTFLGSSNFLLSIIPYDAVQNELVHVGPLIENCTYCK